MPAIRKQTLTNRETNQVNGKKRLISSTVIGNRWTPAIASNASIIPEKNRAVLMIGVVTSCVMK